MKIGARLVEEIIGCFLNERVPSFAVHESFENDGKMFVGIPSINKRVSPSVKRIVTTTTDEN